MRAAADRKRPVPSHGTATAIHSGGFSQTDLLDAIDQGFCIVQVLFDERGDPTDYRFLEINAAFEALTGLEGAVGRTMRELRPDHEEHWFAIYGRVARTGEPVRFERPAKALARWYSVYAFRVGAPSKDLVGILFSDITERKRTELERDALEERLASDLDAMRRLQDLSTRLVVSGDLPKLLEEVLDATLELQKADFGNIQLWDEASQTLSIAVQRGFSPVFLEQFRVVGEKDAAKESACGRALRLRERIVIEDVHADPAFEPYRAIADHEGYRAVQSTPMIAADGRPLGMLSTHFRQPHRPSERDLHLTDLYLRLASELLERLRREQELRQAKDAAERANVAKTNFLSTMSHELRTPLNAVVGFCDLLSSEVSGPLNALQKSHIRRIQASSWHLVEIIDEILTFARAEAGRVEVHAAPVDLAALARNVVAMLGTQARGLELRLVGVDGRVDVSTDGAKVRQILTNLVGNALRYTERGSVEVEVTAEAGSVAIRVRDTGPGIAAESLDEIFEPFVQLDPSRTREKGGAGLGLAICRRLARLLGGDIAVRSEPGRGSTFTLHLPRLASRERAPRAAEPAAHRRWETRTG